MIRRREFLIGAAATALAAPAGTALASTGEMSPPLTDKAAFVAWGKAHLNEDPVYLERRFDRYREVSSFGISLRQGAHQVAQ